MRRDQKIMVRKKNAKTSLPGTLRLQSRIPAVLFASSINRPKWSAEFVTLFLNRWRTGKRPSLTVHQWFLKICGWPQKFVNETGSSSILTIWFINATKFVNGSSIAADDRKTASMTQKVRQWPKSSSILTNTSCTLTNYWRTSSSILTNFLGCWRTVVVTENHWRTIDEPLTKLAALTNQIVNIDELPVSLTKLLWSPACFEEPWANLGALMISSSMRPQWQTLLSHDDLAWSIASWNELSFNCHGWSFVDFFLYLRHSWHLQVGMFKHFLLLYTIDWQRK